MGRFPFDRLLTAVAPLCAQRRVFAQTGPSGVVLPCDSVPFLAPDRLADLLAAVPIVITHAGNTVRLVQNLDKVPIAVARRAEFGEMADDHQVAYVQREQRAGRIIVVEPDAAALRHAVDNFADLSAAMSARPLPTAVPGTAIADQLDEIVGALAARPRGARLRAAIAHLPGRDRGSRS